MASTSELAARIGAIPSWYHKIALPDGTVTPGWAPIDAASYGIPERLDGMRVLDVGACDGYWSFEALRRGAREVVAIDDFSTHAQRRAWERFDLCRDALGFSPETCQRHEMSVYDVGESRLGRFDVVFCFGTLYHLRHPLLALDRLAAVCDREIYVENAILDDFSPYLGGLGLGYPSPHMVMEFYAQDQYGQDATNWWVPTLACLGHMVNSAGFPYLAAWKLVEKPPDLAHCRGFIRGSKVAEGS